MSKVRSISLDSLSDREALLILALGNSRMNKIFEKKITTSSSSSRNEGKKDVDDDNNNYTVHKNIEKPVITEHTGRAELEKWIKRKYVTKEFLLAGPGDENYEVEMVDHRDKESKELYDASCSLNINKMAHAIALGGDVNWKCNQPSALTTDDNNTNNKKRTAKEECEKVPTEHENDREKEAFVISSTSLGACLRNKSEESKVECIELLLQNGSSLSLLSTYEHSLLDTHLSSTSDGSSITNSTHNATTAADFGGSPSSTVDSTSSNANSTETTTSSGEKNEDNISDILSSIESLYIPVGKKQTKQ